MTVASMVNTFNCTQCGGELHPDQGQLFLTCPFCTSTVYLDKTQVVFHHYVASTLAEDAARAALRAWMSGNDTVKDLDKKSSVVSIAFTYFPLWYFKIKTQKGREVIALEPAAAMSILDIKRLSIPAGDLRRFDSSVVKEAVEPTVPLDAARSWLSRQYPENEKILESALVHVPIYLVTYQFQNRKYTAIVEASTGRVIASIYPEKSNFPYQLISTITVGGYIFLSLVPIFSALAASDSMEGFFTGVAIYILFGGIFFVVCMIIALVVAARV